MSVSQVDRFPCVLAAAMLPIERDEDEPRNELIGCRDWVFVATRFDRVTKGGVCRLNALGPGCFLRVRVASKRHTGDTENILVVNSYLYSDIFVPNDML